MDNFVIASLNVGGHTELMDFEKTDQWHKLLELTHATWRVADNAIENEFLKNRVKQAAAEILVGYPNALGDRKKTEDLLSSIRSQRALISLAQKTSTSRELNFTILKNEYHKIGMVVTQLMPPAATVAGNEVKHHLHGASKKEASAASSVMTTHRNADGESAKEEVSQKQQEKETSRAGGAQRTERVEVLTEREKKIYQFFSKRKEDKIRLKEIAQVFPDLTDRTVRNDLRALCIKKLVVRSDGHGQASFYKLGNVIAEA